ncbi:energy-coupling factor ABC transporter ATP-binding protein [Spirulina subsalsa FACHB-351]|uniref:Energy-coupling factor ABC transporter ATP-binding protein n=1 Tax=Spirulina subsalsa FACHB-351 TaxID=234711 RepID=A0ABT3L585_9CYAN|nr:ABC transporter ATP-binding protein [Spirulina subsalsa]MCW6036357.1 energy-coupling factor ABC transporter ATP-binding protein [Spirulina subsalsa FACHB-351]
MQKQGSIPTLKLNHVTYSYPGSSHLALDDVSLSIAEDQVSIFIGRNGCGKTTLFCLANGLFRPQKGVIEAFGKPLGYDHRALNQLRQKVGFVFQNPEHQLVATTVEEDLSYGLFNFGYSEGEVRDRVQQTLVDFDLVELADTPIHHLSLGQKKRLAIADVMILQPQLLLLDEPTAYLDPYQTRNFIDLLQQIRAGGTTIAIATHNLDFAYTYGDWLLVLDQGKLVTQGTPQTVFNESQIVKDLQLGRPLILDVLDLLEEPEKSRIARQFIQSGEGKT